MIPVTLQPEPKDFDEKVRIPGNLRIKNGQCIINYWSRCKEDLKQAYRYFCAYTNIQLLGVDASIDHFVPKSKDRDLIYEWSNYRLTSLRINACKREFTDVLDPFAIEIGWFQLNILTGEVFANPNAEISLKQKIQQTIKRLKLNDNEYKNYRLGYITDYMKGEISSKILEQKAPYIYTEMKRQGVL